MPIIHLPTFHVGGPVTINLDGRDLGVNQSGVHFRLSLDWDPIYCDNLGPKTMVDAIQVGKSCVVECIGMDMDLIRQAHPWLNNLFAVGAEIGALASANARILRIQERLPSDTWIANRAVLVGVLGFGLTTGTELRVPLTFTLLPDENLKLFSEVPSYLRTQ